MSAKTSRLISGPFVPRPSLLPIGAAWITTSLLGPAMPVLDVDFVSSDSVRLSWDAAETDWVVEGGMDAADWTTELKSPVLDGGKIALTLPIDAPAFFWRLRSQETSGIAGGRNFLRDSQGKVFGVWSAGSGRELRNTTAALEGLLAVQAVGPLPVTDDDSNDVPPSPLDEAFTPTLQSAFFERGLDGLQSLTPRNNDELARMISVLAVAGRPVTPLVDALLDSQNPPVSAGNTGYPGSGWGLAVSYTDTTLDTALALRALRAADLPEGLCVVGEEVPPAATSPAHAFEVPPGATGLTLGVRQAPGNLRFTLTRPDLTTTFVDSLPELVPYSVPLGTAMEGSWSLTVTNNTGGPLKYAAEVHFDTAEAFDVGQVTTAASYLGLAQNPDGGWGITPGADSHLMITCEVMKTLAARGGEGFLVGLTAGADWLYNQKKNADGGFSSEPGSSNLLETALAVLAIRRSPLPPNLGDAVAFIEAGQLLNGSWSEDPHLTALALQVLAGPPEVAPIPGQSVVAPAAFAQIHLDDHVSDPDHADSDISWSVSGQDQLMVSLVDRVATITYPADTELSEVLTFTATDPDGLVASRSATFGVSLTPAADYTIARGGSATGTRSFTTTPANFAGIGFFTAAENGLAPGVNYTTTNVSLIGPDTIQVNFEITVDPGAAAGIEEFSVEYGLLDGAEQPLLPVFDNVFEFTINITP